MKVSFGVVEAVNGNIKALLRRGRRYRNLPYLLLKAQQMTASKTEFVVMRKVARYAGFFTFSFRAGCTFRKRPAGRPVSERCGMQSDHRHIRQHGQH